MRTNVITKFLVVFTAIGTGPLVSIAADVSLVSAEFNQPMYCKGDGIAGKFIFRNEGASTLIGLTLEIWFEIPPPDPQMVSYHVGGIKWGLPPIDAGKDYSTGWLPLLTVSPSADSGAYLPEVILKNASGITLSTYTVSDTSDMLPVIPVGVFPILNNLVVRSPSISGFSTTSPASVNQVLRSFATANFHKISLLLKTEVAEWGGECGGQILFNKTTERAKKATNPLNYDLYAVAQAYAGALNMTIDPWIVAFWDEAALADHPRGSQSDWSLPNINTFINATVKEARDYEAQLVSDLLNNYTTPTHLYLDAFRFEGEQPDPSVAARKEAINLFVEAIAKNCPTQLGGYMFGPWHSNWTGQDYSSLNKWFGFFSPMLYWQTANLVVHHI